MTGRFGTVLVVLAVVLAVAGAGLSGYLAVVNLQGDTGVCVGVHGCHAVQTSRYGKIIGIPVSVPGFFVYGMMALAAAGWRRSWGGLAPELAFLGFLGALTGVLMSAYLTYVEAFVLDAWCSYCVASALLMAALFAIWSAILRAEFAD
jgi:uncharacterized membrane protein